jgi:hypothetical protein
MSIQHAILFSVTYATMFAMFVAFLALGVERSLARSQVLLVLSGLAFVCMVISLFTP